MGCYGRAVPGPRCYGPERPPTRPPNSSPLEFSLRARCRARGSASIAKYVLFCPQVKFNNINLPPEAERWLHSDCSIKTRPPPLLHAICFRFLTRTLCSSARLPPFLTCMSFPQFNSRPFSFLFPLHVSRFLKSGRCYEVLAES